MPHALIQTCVFFLCLLFSTYGNAKNAEQIPYLNSIDEKANYLTSKNFVKKIVSMHIFLEKKSFLLGTYDVRDGIENRIPNENYNELLEKMRKFASPIATSSVPPVADDSSLPDGLQTASERLSYLTARAITKSFGKNGIPILPDSIMLGFNDAQSSDTPKISTADEKNINKLIQDKLKETDDDWAKNRNIYYLNEEKTFLAANIIKPDVNLLPSGVQYKIIEKGYGKTPKENSKVTVSYRGMLLDGTVFDENYKRGKPDTFKLSAMIKGFSEGLMQIPAGSKVVLYIPSSLAYGEKGTQGIPPYAAIIFEIELFDVKFGMFE